MDLSFPVEEHSGDLKGKKPEKALTCGEMKPPTTTSTGTFISKADPSWFTKPSDLPVIECFDHVFEVVYQDRFARSTGLTGSSFSRNPMTSKPAEKSTYEFPIPSPWKDGSSSSDETFITAESPIEKFKLSNLLRSGLFPQGILSKLGVVFDKWEHSMDGRQACMDRRHEAQNKRDKEQDSRDQSQKKRDEEQDGRHRSQNKRDESQYKRDISQDKRDADMDKRDEKTVTAKDPSTQDSSVGKAMAKSREIIVKGENAANLTQCSVHH